MTFKHFLSGIIATIVVWGFSTDQLTFFESFVTSSIGILLYDRFFTIKTSSK
ncbi:hypothetical protein [Bacillus infantis]|uniref:hypothetical protein n=1 Tax=Bacillus infantis TaxID=324767 RepID=UPI003CED4E58